MPIPCIGKRDKLQYQSKHRCHTPPSRPVAPTGRAADSKSAGWGFESLRACSIAAVARPRRTGRPPHGSRFFLPTAAPRLAPAEFTCYNDNLIVPLFRTQKQIRDGARQDGNDTATGLLFFARTPCMRRAGEATDPSQILREVMSVGEAVSARREVHEAGLERVAQSRLADP